MKDSGNYEELYICNFGNNRIHLKKIFIKSCGIPRKDTLENELEKNRLFGKLLPSSFRALLKILRKEEEAKEAYISRLPIFCLRYYG